jgi:hypothetical protein
MSANRKVRASLPASATQRKRPKPRPLSEQIEVIRERTDVRDDDLSPYVAKLVSSLQDLKPIDEISLLTQEDAAQALATIERTLEELNNHLGTARSLKHLLQMNKR